MSFFINVNTIGISGLGESHHTFESFITGRNYFRSSRPHYTICTIIQTVPYRSESHSSRSGGYWSWV